MGLWVMVLSQVGGVRDSAPEPALIPEWLLISLFPNAKQRNRMVKILVDVNLWEDVNGRLFIHDLADYNPSTDEIEERRKGDRERQRRKRERDKAEQQVRATIEAEFSEAHAA